MGFKYKRIPDQFIKCEKAVKPISGSIAERLIIDETHGMQPGKLIIGSEPKTEIIITMSLEKYIELKQQIEYLKGKEATVEERIDLARDSGYYQGRDALYEDLLKEENPEPAPIDILDPKREIENYKERIIRKLENEKNRLNNLLQKDKKEIEPEPFYRINGKIEGLKAAIMITEEECK